MNWSQHAQVVELWSQSHSWDACRHCCARTQHKYHLQMKHCCVQPIWMDLWQCKKLFSELKKGGSVQLYQLEQSALYQTFFFGYFWFERASWKQALVNLYTKKSYLKTLKYSFLEWADPWSLCTPSVTTVAINSTAVTPSENFKKGKLCIWQHFDNTTCALLHYQAFMKHMKQANLNYSCRPVIAISGAIWDLLSCHRPMKNGDLRGWELDH